MTSNGVISNATVASTVAAYVAAHPDEEPSLEALLYAVGAARPVTDRKTMPLHVTCAAVAVTPDRRVLQVLHNRLDLWLPPGGHIETADTSLAATALREMAEETGVDPSSVTAVSDEPFDIAAHRIPERLDKGEPAHIHYDLRYLVRLPEQPATIEPAEVRAVRWLALAELNGRLGGKLERLR